MFCWPVSQRSKTISLLTERWELSKNSHSIADWFKKEINGLKLIIWYAKVWKTNAQEEVKGIMFFLAYGSTQFFQTIISK